MPGFKNNAAPVVPISVFPFSLLTIVSDLFANRSVQPMKGIIPEHDTTTTLRVNNE